MDAYVQEVLPFQEKQFPELVRRLRETARKLAAERGEITSDDIHGEYPIPTGVDPRIMGSVFMPRRDWVRVGQRKSKRGVNHGRFITIWRLREAEAA